MLISDWRIRLAKSLPFYYGWVVFGVMGLVSYSSRPMMAVATLAVFMVPMTEELGWSRGQFAGAVSLGGVMAVGISPLVGWWVDRYGSAVVVAAGGVITGGCAIGLSMISHPAAFYALYIPGRMAFASPLELGPSTSLSNWFVRRRATVLGWLGVTHGTGLTIMPFVAQLLIQGYDWKTAWWVLGAYTLSIAVAPALVLVARRPEDMGIEPDLEPDTTNQRHSPAAAGTSPTRVGAEPEYTLKQALYTRAFWSLAAFSAAGFMVQAGVSLHQAGHYLQRGISAEGAAGTVSAFAFSQVPGGLFWAYSSKRIPVRFLLAATGLVVGAGAVGTAYSSTLAAGVASASLLGAGVGGLHTLLRIAWADYYGRRHLGSIRGVTLPVQIAGQACGPVIAGFMWDFRDSYYEAFMFFAIAVAVGAALVLYSTPPSRRTAEPGKA